MGARLITFTDGWPQKDHITSTVIQQLGLANRSIHRSCIVDLPLEKRSGASRGNWSAITGHYSKWTESAICTCASHGLLLMPAHECWLRPKNDPLRAAFPILNEPRLKVPNGRTFKVSAGKRRVNHLIGKQVKILNGSNTLIPAGAS